MDTLIPGCSIHAPFRAFSRYPLTLSGRGLLGLLLPSTDDAVAETRSTRDVSLVVRGPCGHHQHLLGNATKTLTFAMEKGADVRRSWRPCRFGDQNAPTPVAAVRNNL